MSKRSKEAAIESYPVKGEWVGNQYGEWDADINRFPRKIFQEGYEQAEKDLALTIEDIELLHTFLYAIKNNKHGCFTFTRLSNEQYEEVLRRFREMKNK